MRTHLNYEGEYKLTRKNLNYARLFKLPAHLNYAWEFKLDARI